MARSGWSHAANLVPAFLSSPDLRGFTPPSTVVSGINDLNLIERLASVVALEHEAFGVLVAERSGRGESLGAESAV
jgi:hypothetical protein